MHTELFSDGVRDLVEAGVINGKRKTLHPNKVISNFVMGTPKLYDWIHDNNAINMYPEDYVNEPWVVAQNYHMTAINSALEVDVLGQVAADTLGPMQFSGVGGQVDFVRGAAARWAENQSLPFLRLPEGQDQPYVAVLARGSAVTTSRR